MKRLVSLMVLASLLASGCSSNVREWSPAFQGRDEVKGAVKDMQLEQNRQLSNSVVTDLEGPYLGGGQYARIDESHDLPSTIDLELQLQTPRALTLGEVGAWLSDSIGVPVYVEGEGSRTANLDYSGRVSDLLDTIADRYDATWRYQNGVLTIAHILTRSYEIAAFPSTVASEISVTTESDAGGGGGDADEVSYQSSGGGMSTTVTGEDSPWDSIESALSQTVGSYSYTVNRSAMGIIVSAPPSVQNSVQRYVDQYNEMALRQVAVKVEVYSFGVSDNRSAGFNLDAIYESLQDGYNIGVSGPNLPDTEGSALTASILDSSDSRFSGSSALLRALREWGETSLVTSGSAVLLNGQRWPINSVNRRDYLRKSSSNQVVNAGVSSDLEPGTVTTGFTMDVVPFIRSDNRVLLQYGFSLSDLVDLGLIESGDASIQVPNVDDRRTFQRSMMPLGSTIVVAGLQRDLDDMDRSSGVSGASQQHEQNKHMIFVMITATRA